MISLVEVGDTKTPSPYGRWGSAFVREFDLPRGHLGVAGPDSLQWQTREIPAFHPRIPETSIQNMQGGHMAYMVKS